MSKPSPFAPFLPLTFTHNSWQYSTIYDANNNAVCRLDLEDWAVTEDNQDSLEAVQQQYATFIVKACNSHDALVKALQFYADPIRYDGPNQRVIGDDPYTPKDRGYLQDVTRDGGVIAREALAKAGGGT